jgi:hypothetical protein
VPLQRVPHLHWLLADQHLRACWRSLLTFYQPFFLFSLLLLPPCFFIDPATRLARPLSRLRFSS